MGRYARCVVWLLVVVAPMVAQGAAVRRPVILPVVYMVWMPLVATE